MTIAFQRWQKALAVSLSTFGCTPSTTDFGPARLQAMYTSQYQNTTPTYNSILHSQCQEMQSSNCVLLENCSYLYSSYWEIKQKAFLISIPLLCN